MKLILLGDIGVCNEVDRSDSWERPLGEFDETEPSHVLFNWELPCGRSVVSEPRRSGGPRIVANPDAPLLLRNWRPATACLANNHALDAGFTGLQETIKEFESIGIGACGARTATRTAETPLILTSEAGSVGILNWVMPETDPDDAVPVGDGANLWPGVRQARQQIRRLSQYTDWTVAYLHWSDERFSFPRPEDRNRAAALIEMGIDAVIGHHPHVVRGFECIRDRPVFYSLGNFYFSDIRSEGGGWKIKQVNRNKEALVVELRFRRGERLEWAVHSFWQRGNCTSPDPRNRAVRRMRKSSGRLTDKHYSRWYRKARRRFDRWAYRIYFRLPQIGFFGTAKWFIRMAITRLGPG